MDSLFNTTTHLTLAAFGPIDWLVLVGYMGMMLAIGWWASRGQTDEHTYFQGGRAMPTWAVALSVLATALSAATFIGAPQIAYSGDLSYLILNIGGILGAVFVAVVFLPPLYHAGTITIYGYLGRRFGPAATLAASITFLFGRLLASGARLFMAGIAFSLILFGDIHTSYLLGAIVVFGVIGTIYTALGGIKAVIWTDVVQIVVVVGAVILSIVMLLDAIPLSIGQIYELLQEREKLRVVDTSPDLGKAFTLWAAVAVTFANVASYGVDQDLVQRMLTTRSAWRASLSLVVSNLLGIPVVGLFLIAGLLLSIFYGMPEVMGDAAPTEILDDTRKVYPQYLVNHLPMGLAGLAMAGLFAAAMSSFDSAVNAMASSLVADLQPGRAGGRGAGGTVAASRWAVIGMGVLLSVFAIGAALMQQAGGQDLINFALGVMSFAYAGLLGVFLTALLTRRGTVTSVVIALVAGALVVLAMQPYVLAPMTEAMFGEPFAIAWPYWMVVGTAVSFAICAAPKGGQSLDVSSNE